jgi:uncharacterized protein with FMN-binding domain
MKKPGKIFLSGGLILASGAYAWWHHATEAKSLAPATVALRQARLTPPAPPVAVASPPGDSLGNAPMAQPVTPPAPPPSAPPVARMEPKAEAVKPKAEDRDLKDALIAGTPAPPPPPALGPPPPPPPPETPNIAPPVQQAAAGTGRYIDGDFVGASVDGEWGPVQVKVAVRSGNVAQVICIEYPFHRRRSAEISEYAIPILVEETIKTQDAKIDWVSQASYTSEQFQQSLASALTRAKKSPPA